jgi:hypothetical protein
LLGAAYLGGLMSEVLYTILINFFIDNVTELKKTFLTWLDGVVAETPNKYDDGAVRLLKKILGA